MVIALVFELFSNNIYVAVDINMMTAIIYELLLPVCIRLMT